MLMKRVVIGLTGAFGSGTSFIAKHFFEPRGFKSFSLSAVLKKEYEEQNGKKNETRQQLQDFGNSLRKDNQSYLAESLDRDYIKDDKESNIVIDSIRNPAEIKYFREKFPEFILIGVFADYDERWKRVKKIYQDSKDAFDIDEKKDKGTFEPKYGQRISDCFFESDLILSNNKDINPNPPGNEEYRLMSSKIDSYLSALKEPAVSNPTLKETLMAAAYTSGRRSKCIKRKVGAVITDKYDRIISSGFNGVPINLKECNPSLGECYRDMKRRELSKKICDALDVECTNNSEKVVFKNVKLLELCRALHGEESAIMNLVGRGVVLDKSVMYVTTYPCNLCANKIVQAGISRVVYFEPYPVEEAKEILKEGGVETEPFEGVTFRAFFKFYQYEP